MSFMKRLVTVLKPNIHTTWKHSNVVTNNIPAKAISMEASITLGSMRKDAWTNIFFSVFDDLDSVPSLVKEVYKKKFGNSRSQKELEFMSKKTKDGFSLFLNVCGCDASEVEVKVNGRFVSIRGEGKASFDDPWKHGKGISLPEDVRFDLSKVVGYVQKGQVEVFFPKVDDELHHEQKDDLHYDIHGFHKIKCVDLPFERTGVSKHDQSETETVELELDIFTLLQSWLLTIGMLALGKKGIRAWYHIPEELDWKSEFNEKGFNAFLNVSGCSAGELAMTLNSERNLKLKGTGAALAGAAEVNMFLEVPINFKFDPAEVKAFVWKGELHILFPYSKVRVESDKTRSIPSMDV